MGVELVQVLQILLGVALALHTMGGHIRHE